jgi:hypothetical protein
MAAETGKAANLIAILLVTRTRPGPKLVFCYPPSPRSSQFENHGNKNGLDSAEGTDSESDDNGMPTPLRRIVTNDAEVKNGKTADVTPGESHDAETEGVLGFSEDSIEKLLSPGCWCDRQKFEISLDGLTFICHPIYAAQDGSWAHKHTHETTPRKDVRSTTASKSPPPKPVTAEDDGHEKPGITITEPKTPAKVVHDFTHVPESFESHGGLSLGTSMNSASTTSPATPEPLMSFSVVFVVRADRSDSQSAEVSELYNHVLKKLSKALHYCQKHNSYIGTQSRKLMTLKAKAKQDGTSKAGLCQQMVDRCELAWALKEVFEKISAGAVADIRLEEKEMSLHVPKKLKSDELQVEPHCGLLLLEDKETLLRELTHPDASALAHFLRGHTPNKSLQKLAGRLGMSVDHVLHLARYLVAWQKARAIAPLHSRNIYILGPDAPLAHLQDHIATYARLFPVLPSLPRVLEVLFERPRIRGMPLRYVSMMPSKDHREPYMAVLAFLVRNRFVQQLKTSGWLRAPTVLEKNAVAATINQNRRPLSVASLLSPQLRPVDDDAASVSSERTAIPLTKIDSQKKRPDVTSGANRSDEQSVRSIDSFQLITSPLNPSTEDLARLQYIKESIADTELSHRLPSLLRYFDGESALEEIGAREGLKRSVVDAWLDQLLKAGFLSTFYHV